MATVKISGLDELQSKLSQLSKDVELELADEMLDAGAEIAIRVWQDTIKAYDYIDTGDMHDSVGVTNQTKKGSIREIYPLGKDNKGVRNAEKAFYLHYGKTTMLGSRFVDYIDDTVSKEATKAMEKVYSDYIKNKGL